MEIFTSQISSISEVRRDSASCKGVKPKAFLLSRAPAFINKRTFDKRAGLQKKTQLRMKHGRYKKLNGLEILF